MQNLAITQALKSSGANIGFRLHHAAQSGDKDLVQELLASGIAASLADDRGFTALHVASANGQLAVASLLMKHSNVADIINCTTKDTASTPLHLAVHPGYTGLVQLLLDSGANELAININGQSCLHIAAMAGHQEVTAIILSHAAEDMAMCEQLVNMSDKKSMTGLLLAARSGHAEISVLLIEHGANSQVTDSLGNSALHLTAMAGHLQCAKSVVSQGAPLHLNNSEGYAPLHLATQAGHHPVVLYLLKVGAKPSMPTSKGQTPVMLAAANGHMPILHELLKAGEWIILLSI